MSVESPTVRLTLKAGGIVTAMCTFMLYVWKVNSGFNQILNTNAALVERMADLERKSVTIDMAAELQLRTVIANPGLKLPDPRDPSRLITIGPSASTP